MPRVPTEKEVIQNPKLSAWSDLREIKESGRWQCPCCKAIHHFLPTDGCHNQKCGFRGVLKRVQ